MRCTSLPLAAMTDYYNWGMKPDNHLKRHELPAVASQPLRPKTTSTWMARVGRAAFWVGFGLSCVSLYRRHCSIGRNLDGQHRVGDIKWWPCDGPNDIPGAECGYAMWVPVERRKTG